MFVYIIYIALCGWKWLEKCKSKCVLVHFKSLSTLGYNSRVQGSARRDPAFPRRGSAAFLRRRGKSDPRFPPH